jgi:hypothetical protein
MIILQYALVWLVLALVTGLVVGKAIALSGGSEKNARETRRALQNAEKRAKELT